MRYSQWSMAVLGLVSCIAAANTTQTQPPSATSARPGVSAPAKDSTAGTPGACYALDTAARHECIYATVVRGRTARTDALN